MSDKETAPTPEKFWEKWAEANPKDAALMASPKRWFKFAAAFAAECRAPAPQPAERSDKDYAIEHAEYLAKSVEHYQATKNAFAEFMESADRDRDEEMIDQFRSDLSESWRGMNFCIFEFRKRAKRALPAAPEEKKS